MGTEDFSHHEAFPQLTLGSNIFIHHPANSSCGIVIASSPPGISPGKQKTAFMVTSMFLQQITELGQSEIKLLETGGAENPSGSSGGFCEMIVTVARIHLYKNS